MAILEKVGRRVIDEKTFPSSRSIGTPVPVVFGRALRHRCPHISFGNEIELAGNQEAGRNNIIVSSVVGVGINDLLVIDVGSTDVETVRITGVRSVDGSHVLDIDPALAHNHNNGTPVTPLGVRQDYLLGEGVWGDPVIEGRPGGYFEEVYQVYHNERALPEFSCPENFQHDPLPAGTTQFTLDPVHRVQLRDWYRNYHIQFIGEDGEVVEAEVGGVTYKAESDITRYNPDDNTVQIDLPGGAPNFTCYKMREYKFFDGSQDKPFPGYAFIRLARKYTGEIRADVKGFDLTSPTSVMLECIKNYTWGGKSEIPVVFERESSIGSEYMFEGVVERPVEIVNLFREIAKFRPFQLTRRRNDIFIKFASDTDAVELPEDGYTSKPVLEYLNLNERRKSVKVDYRLDHSENETQLSRSEENIQPLGIEEEVFLPFVYDTETADRVLYREVQYQVARTHIVQFEIDPKVILEGELGVGSRITIPAGLAGEGDTEWVIDSITHKTESNLGVVAYRYTSGLYSYPGTGARGIIEVGDSYIPETDFSETPPEPARDLASEFVRGDRTQFIVRYRLPIRNCRGTDVVIRRGDAEATRHSNLLRGVDLDSDAEHGVEKRTFEKPDGAGSISIVLYSLPANENNELIGFPIQVVLGESPIANAGNDRSVTVGGAINLDGSGSSDPDGDALTYSWRQISGPTVAIRNANQVRASVTAPSSSGTLVFELTVSDGTSSATDSVTVTVNPRSSVYVPPTQTPDPDPEPTRRYVCEDVITGYRTETASTLGAIVSVGLPAPAAVPPAGEGWTFVRSVVIIANRHRTRHQSQYFWTRQVPIIEEQCEWVTDE